MASDQDKFLSLKKEKGGNVTFGDKASTKIVGKHTISLGNGRTKEENVLLIEDLSIIFSVSSKCVTKDTLSPSTPENVR